MTMLAEPDLPRATDGQLAAVNLESARRRAWARFAQNPRLPGAAEPTHLSLFDKSNEGLRMIGKPVFSVQYHPEASPGPQDSHYLFEHFVRLMGGNA